MTSPIVKKVTDTNICIGCGLCATICPQHVLKMEWNRIGEYVPQELSPCVKECGLCLRTCPFSIDNMNEDTIGKLLYSDIPGIHHHAETGYHLVSYVGCSEEHRMTSASGGIVTWVLETLLAEGTVDRVICVSANDDPSRLFTFQVFDSVEGLRSGTGAAYYPVEMSSVLGKVLSEPGRYAITGLPCFIKALRLAQGCNEKLRQRIVVTIGLVCGQLKSKQFTEYVAALSGMKGVPTSVHYRGKSPDRPSNNYYYSFTNMNGEETHIDWLEGISDAWTRRWFTPNACNYCDDIFAECADLTCMDAWLPAYVNDSKGTSLAIVRSPLVQNLLARGKGIQLEEIAIDLVLESQKGVCEIKREHLAYRLFLEEKRSNRCIEKRVKPNRNCNFFLRREISLKDRMREKSGENWINMDRNVQKFHESLRWEIRNMQLLSRMASIVVIPKKSLFYIKRKIAKK